MGGKMVESAVAEGLVDHPLNYFDRIQVINLRSRTDRRQEMASEFRRIRFDLGRIEWFDAVKPADRGEFESIGARGCFLSHLAILQQNAERPPERLLIMEDDVSFSEDFMARLSEIVEQLQRDRWDVFYGGGRVGEIDAVAAGLARVPQDMGIGCTHFLAIRGDRIGAVADYLAAQLGRPAGDPAGGPMHVDGSYSWARKELGLETLMASPEIAFQRPSRSDIAQGQWWDRVPGLSELGAMARSVRNRLRKRG